MKIRCRKIQNISEVSVPVRINEHTTVYLPVGGEMLDQDVYNLPDLKGLVKTEQDLSEVNPLTEGREGRIKLYD